MRVRNLIMEDQKKLQPDNVYNEPPITTTSGHFLLEARQRKIWEALIKRDKRLGDIYLGSLQVLADKNNPARFTLAAHGFRALGWLYRGEKSTEEKTQKDDGEGFKAIIKKKIAQSDPLGGAPDTLLEDVARRWNVEVQKWFNKIAKTYDAEVSTKEFENKVRELENILFPVVNPHFDVINAIDRLFSVPKPQKRDISQLKNLLAKGRSAYAYFFEKAEENWLTPLVRGGFFRNPPPQQGWPESMYLVRIAGKKSQKVMNIIKSCPATNNQWVYDNFIQAAMNMSPDIGSQIVSSIQKQEWLKSTYHILLPHKVAEFMEKLVQNGKIRHALTLAYLLTDVTADKPKRIKGIKGPLSIIHPDAKPIFNDQWQYKRIVEENTKELRAKAPERVLWILCSRLEKALELEDRSSKKAADFYEYSHIWRNNLEESRIPNHEDVKNVLLGGIIDLIRFVGENKPEKLKEISGIIKKQEHPIFRRVELYFYRVFPDQFLDDIRRLLTDERAIKANNLRREYVPLLSDHFSNLSKASQKRILKVIGSGFGIARPKKWPKERFNNMILNQQLLYLRSIADKLPSNLKQWYEKKLKKYGEPYDDDGGIKSWTGPTSPIPVSELHSKTVEEVVDYLATWEPPEEKFAAPSPEGLGRLFQETVTQRYPEFSKATMSLFEKKVRAVYIYHLFYGLKDALKNNQCFDWRPVINLCTAIIRATDYSTFPKMADDFEPDWHSVKKSMIDLIGYGFTFKHCYIPFEFREQVWEVIRIISDDEDPTPEYEQKYGGDNMDPATLSINTVRGEATHTLIKYALWCSRNLYPTREEAAKVESKLVPEAQEVLDKHLDPAIDPALTIRAVYGWYLPNLFYLNKQWVIQNLDKIFPEDPSQRELWIAGWETYLSNNPYHDLFPILKEKYRRSISLLGATSKKGHKYADLNELLPHHLMIVYAHDLAHDDLIDEFFEKAPVQARGEALSFVGRVILKKELTKIPPDEIDIKIEKFKTLWEKRLNLPKDKQYKEEFKEFGWWFARSPFDREWTINHMVRTLEVTGGEIEPEHELPKELRDYVDEFPVQAISALNLIARGDKEGWRIRFNNEDYRNIIQQAMNSGNKKAEETATDLIHYLGQRGYTEYRELLK